VPLNQKQLMENPTRRALLGLLAEEKELNSAQLREQLHGGYTLAQVVYHLRQLEVHGLVSHADGLWRQR
jgi:DNA-binding transcriptional ArsR family regulator